MKTTPTLSCFALCLFLAASSCKYSKDAIAERKTDIHLSKETTASCFVELKDGTIQHFTTLKLVTGVLKTPYLLADGVRKIAAKDIRAYQNKDHYAISQENFVTGHKTYIAKETLPGFAVRIAKGKINVYTKKYYNGVAAVDEYFIQLGDDGQIVAYTAETMNLMVKQEPEALDFFVAKKYTTPKSTKNLIPDATYANTKTSVKRIK